MSEYEVKSGGIGAHAKKLVAETADTITFEDDVKEIEVVSDGTAALYVKVDPAVEKEEKENEEEEIEIIEELVPATVAGADCFYLPAVPSVRKVRSYQEGATVVSLISAGTPTYSVARVIE